MLRRDICRAFFRYDAISTAEYGALLRVSALSVRLILEVVDDKGRVAFREVFVSLNICLTLSHSLGSCCRSVLLGAGAGDTDLDYAFSEGVFTLALRRGTLLLVSCCFRFGAAGADNFVEKGVLLAEQSLFSLLLATEQSGAKVLKL